MPIPIRVLIVEDSESDALLLVRHLRQGGFEPAFQRLDTSEAFEKALDRTAWDLVICDYKMPGFDGPTALEIFKSRGIDIPFIVVSGMIGEDVAVAMMTSGAHDYLLKDNLARLVPAIERELREAEERRNHRRAEEARSHLAAIVESSDDGIISATADGVILSWNKGAEKILGYSSEEAVGRSLFALMPLSVGEQFLDVHRKTSEGSTVNRLETRCTRKDGSQIDVSLTLSPIRMPDGRITGASTIVRDITERKRAEAEREKLLAELSQAMKEVKALSGLLPICAGCKKIRNDNGYWQQVEIYIQEHSEAEFTHGLCPECMKRLYPQFV